MDAISEEVIRKIGDFDAQGLTNTAWSYAKLSYMPPRILNAIMEEALKKVPQWSPQHLAALSWAFAALTFRSRTLMESISQEVVLKINECGAQDLSNTVWAYAKLGIVHYQMLDSISAAAIKRIHSFTAQNMANTVWAFATLLISDAPLLEANAAESRQRCHEFRAQNFGNILWSFAVLVVEDTPLRDAISAEARTHLSEYDLQALTWLADFDLACHEDLALLLQCEVAKVWEKWESARSSSDVVSESFLGCLRDLRIDNLGAVGSRMMLNHMGVSIADDSLKERALDAIVKHRVEDPREDPYEMKFGGPTRHKRVFSYAEFRVYMRCRGAEALEGARLQENGARGAHTDFSPLKPVPLPINQRVERSACAEFILLTDLCAYWEEVGVRDECDRREMKGILRLFSTGPSCLSCIAAVRQFSLRYPGIHIEMSYTKMEVATPLELRSMIAKLT